MNASSVDIAELLETSGAGLGLTIGTNLFVDIAPSTIDKCTTVIDTPGLNPELNYVYERVGIQILQRGKKFGYTNAYDTLHAIKTYLHGKNDLTLSGTRYILIFVTSDILSLGSDDNNRPLLSCNFRIHRTG